MTVGETWFALHMYNPIKVNKHEKSLEELKCETRQLLNKEETKNWVPASKLKYVFFNGRNHP